MLRAYPEQILRNATQNAAKPTNLQNSNYYPYIPIEYWSVLGITVVILGFSLILAIYYLGKK